MTHNVVEIQAAGEKTGPRYRAQVQGRSHDWRAMRAATSRGTVGFCWLHLAGTSAQDVLRVQFTVVAGPTGLAIEPTTNYGSSPVEMGSDWLHEAQRQFALLCAAVPNAFQPVGGVAPAATAKPTTALFPTATAQPAAQPATQPVAQPAQPDLQAIVAAVVAAMQQK